MKDYIKTELGSMPMVLPWDSDPPPTAQEGVIMLQPQGETMPEVPEIPAAAKALNLVAPAHYTHAPAEPVIIQTNFPNHNVEVVSADGKVNPTIEIELQSPYLVVAPQSPEKESTENADSDDDAINVDADDSAPPDQDPDDADYDPTPKKGRGRGKQSDRFFSGKQRLEMAKYMLAHNKTGPAAAIYFSEKWNRPVHAITASKALQRYRMLKKIYDKEPTATMMDTFKSIYKYTEQERMDMIQYAMAHGPTATARYFSEKLGFVINESTVRVFLRKYNSTSELCSEQMKLEIVKYAKEHGVEAASVHFTNTLPFQVSALTIKLFISQLDPIGYEAD